MIIDSHLTGRILDAATEVHKLLGPGLLESSYATCLKYELQSAGLNVDTEVPVRVPYKGLMLDSAYRLDLIVEDRVVVEVKSVERLLPVHHAQVLTYMRLARLPVGLLLNFNVTLLKFGTRRFVADHSPFPVPPVSSPCPPCPL
jgi:GxxExxY protein